MVLVRVMEYVQCLWGDHSAEVLVLTTFDRLLEQLGGKKKGGVEEVMVGAVRLC